MTNAQRINLTGDEQDGRLAAFVPDYGCVTFYRCTGEKVWSVTNEDGHEIASGTNVDALVDLLAACI